MGMAARLDPADHRRPSVELVFHALLPERIVIHTHPTTVNALTCADTSISSPRICVKRDARLGGHAGRGELAP